MINLPDTCIVNKRIPKSKFYEKLNINTSLKRNFIDQINNITWSYKIAPTTLNIEQGREVNEIEVFTIELSTQDLDNDILYQIDKGIPYHILFLLQFNDKEKACIAYKGSKNYYYSNWYNKDAEFLRLTSNNTDQIYEDFVRELAGEELDKQDDSESLQESVQKAEERVKIEKKIKVLEKKLAREKQFNKQVELNDEIKRLKYKLVK